MVEKFFINLFAFDCRLGRISFGDYMEANYKEIGRRIAMRRKSMNIKQQDLAELLEISNNHLSSIERGKAGPSLDVLIDICNILRVTPDFLLMGSMYATDLPQNILDNLKLCSKQDIELLYKFSCLLVDRNSTQWNIDNFIK